MESQTGVSTVAVVSAASYATTLAPGSIGSILGAGLSGQTAQAELDQNGSYPTELAGTTVQVNGTLAQLLYVSPAQINFLMPAQTQPGSATVVAKASATGITAQGTANVQTVSPGIFTVDASGHGAILNAVTFASGPFGPETAENPGCDKRTRLAIFGTGIRLAAAASLRVEAHDSAGAVSLLSVEYSGPAQTPGLDQVNVILPPDLNASGTMMLTIMAGTASSNKVSFELKARDLASVFAACLVNLNAGSLTLDSGAQMTANVALSAAAPSGGVMIDLASDSPAVHVPANVMVPAGQTSATFQATASSTPSAQNVNLTASLNGISKTITLVVNAPCAASVALSTNVVSGGTGLTGTVQLSAPAPDGGLVVNLQSSDPHVQVASTVTVPGGQTSADFSISTTAGSTSVSATVSASLGACVGASATITVNPNLCVAAVNLSANAVTGGNSLTGTVTLTTPAPSGGVAVNLQSNNPQVQVGATVTVPAGQTSANFNVTTSPGSTSVSAAITASLNGCTGASVPITVNPPPCVAAVNLSANSVVGGSSLTGTVTLTTPAPSGGVLVNLQSSNAQAQVAATVTVPAGQTSANFNITTSAGSSSVTAAITASLSGCAGASGTVTINPPCIASVSLSSNTVTGGDSVTGTVTLNGPAPAGGLMLNLQSDNAHARVAATVTVPAGQTAVNFNVSTTASSTKSSANITASAAGCTGASVTLTVNPPPCVASVSLSANVVTGGATVTGTVTLTGPAPSGGLVVNLQSNNPSVQVAASVTVPAGQTSANFSISTTSGATSASATITATVGICVGASATLTLGPALCVTAVNLSAAAVIGGNGLMATVTLNGPAPSAGLVVNIGSNNPAVQVAATVTVPPGQTSASFIVSTNPVATNATATITAGIGACSATATLTVDAASLVNLALSAATVVGGNGLTGMVTLNGIAPAGGATVRLNSSSLLVIVPSTVTIPAGQSSATFSLSTNPALSVLNIVVTASYDGSTKSATLTLTPF